MLVLLLVASALVVVAVGLAAVGHLGRIADAIEAQNEAYGVADRKEAA